MNKSKSRESLSSKDSSSPTDFTSDDEFSADDDSFDRLSANRSSLDHQSPSVLKIKPKSILNSPFSDSAFACRKERKPPNMYSHLDEKSCHLNYDWNHVFANCPQENPNLSNQLLTPSSSPSEQRSKFDACLDMCLDKCIQEYHDRGNSSGIVEDDVDHPNEDDDHILIEYSPLTRKEVSMTSHTNRRRDNKRMFSRPREQTAPIMCSRLAHCKTLIDAIEFVEQNRDTIDALTSIVTREAPAYRNYDMSAFDTDISTESSFSSDFWLDRRPVITTADGNCQYHAVSISLTGSEMFTPEVRLAAAVAVLDNRGWFDSVLLFIAKGTVLELVHSIARTSSWGDETTLKAIAIAIKKRIFLYTCNLGKKDYEMVKSFNKEELLDAFKQKKYRGGTGIHLYADPLVPVPANEYIMLFHKNEHFIAVLPTTEHPTMFEPYNPILPVI